MDRCQALVATRTQPSCGLSPLVAMHRARPVVAVAGAIADDVLVDGVTGRVVDSALALGPLMHEFGWSETDYDLLAAGSLVDAVRTERAALDPTRRAA